MNSSTPDLYGVEKLMVENSGVEISCKLLEGGHFNPGIFNQEFFNPMVQIFIVEKSGIEKFMVEKFGVERSRVEAWG